VTILTSLGIYFKPNTIANTTTATNEAREKVKDLDKRLTSVEVDVHKL